MTTTMMIITATSMMAVTALKWQKPHSTQMCQEEALHRIWYALRRWRLVSRRIVLFPMTACSSINRR
ncbi:unnamed protein product [Spirodela intermedia]|uniref:Secreted protein n=1 Tax=Spirodela intermedia TaxID=51605 RepID=A0A811G6Y8_SPIIN|nr:unnamed protein product [Spirodela intermedia]